jgi:hypothetical protein
MALAAPAAALAAALDSLVLDAGVDPVVALPHALALRVFARVDVLQRLRCAEVCRGWRALVADTSLWTELDLRGYSHLFIMTRWHNSNALLRAAAARAGGCLRTLRVDNVWDSKVLEVTAANGAALRELRCVDNHLSRADVDSLLRAAPQLCVLETGFFSGSAEQYHAARALLRGEGVPPTCSVRLTSLVVKGCGADETIGLAADLAAHGWTRKLIYADAEPDTPAALDAVVDAALACRMPNVHFCQCQLSPASVVALARLLGGNAVTELAVHNDEIPLLDAAAAVVLRDALHANTSLTSLCLRSVALWEDDTAACLLFGALVGHPRLHELKVSWNGYENDTQGGAQQRTAGAALAALLYANAPALRELRCEDCALGDVGMAPLCAALEHNTHLRVLDCSTNDMPAAFERDVLLPAVRANSSLRELKAHDEAACEESFEAAEAHVAAYAAEEHVAARTAAAQA